jgi:hypothetical protein
MIEKIIFIESLVEGMRLTTQFLTIVAEGILLLLTIGYLAWLGDELCCGKSIKRRSLVTCL